MFYNRNEFYFLVVIFNFECKITEFINTKYSKATKFNDLVKYFLKNLEFISILTYICTAKNKFFK